MDESLLGLPGWPGALGPASDASLEEQPDALRLLHVEYLSRSLVLGRLEVHSIWRSDRRGGSHRPPHATLEPLPLTSSPVWRTPDSRSARFSSSVAS